MPESSINCPICKQPVAVSDPLLPFCSERCRLLDLGNWASGRYAIPAPLSENDPTLDANLEEFGKENGE